MSITLKATDVLTGTIHTNNPDTTETDVLEGKIHTLNETKIDSTLTKKGYAADAQTTGNEIANARLVATDVNDSGNIVLHHSGDETVEQGNDPIPLRAITLPGNSNKYVVVPEDTESKSYPGCFYRTDGVENEWVNPPMIPDTEYRTTERINGKAVYKKADAMGNIVYRLAGESAWVSYVDLVGGNTLVDLIGNLTITGGVYSSNHASAGKFSTTSSYMRSDYIPVKT